MSELTQLLHRAARGDTASMQQLMPLVYERLCALAHGQLRRGGRHNTLHTRELVHEAYCQLFGGAPAGWQDRNHFFAYAAKSMRHILLDQVKQRLAQKRGAQAIHVNLHDLVDPISDAPDHTDLLALDQCLQQMAEKHPRLVQVVELRFFAGLSVVEVAETLALTPRSVERDWVKAKAFINQFLERPPPP